MTQQTQRSADWKAGYARALFDLSRAGGEAFSAPLLIRLKAYTAEDVLDPPAVVDPRTYLEGHRLGYVAATYDLHTLAVGWQGSAWELFEAFHRQMVERFPRP